MYDNNYSDGIGGDDDDDKDDLDDVICDKYK